MAKFHSKQCPNLPRIWYENSICPTLAIHDYTSDTVDQIFGFNGKPSEEIERKALMFEIHSNGTGNSSLRQTERIHENEVVGHSSKDQLAFLMRMSVRVR